MDLLAATRRPATAPCLPGTWGLAPGRAVTLRPREDGELHVVRGRVWVTFDGPHAGPLNDQGDRVLEAGERLATPAGRRLVMEPTGIAATTGACFDWRAAPQTAPVPSQAPAAAALAQPWRDLQQAARLGGRAVAALAAGLATVAARALWPRPAVRPPRVPA